MSIIPINPDEIIALGAIWPPVCAVVMGLRFYVRRTQHATLEIDDWLILPAFILVTGMAVSLLVGVGLHSVGYATPAASSPAAAKTADSFQQDITNRILWAFELMQIIALGLVKLSVLFFYRRIFCTGAWNGVFSAVTIAMITIVLLWTSGFFITWIFLCRGYPAAYWISSATEAEYCIDTGMLHNAFAISDFLTDCLMLLLPIVPVLRLQMSSGRKLALIGVFMLGALTVAASCTRMVIYQKATSAKFHPGSKVDIDLTASISMYWSMLESGLGFCAACLPTLYTLFKTKGLQSIIRSVRSMASIHSHGSKASSPKHTPYATADKSWPKGSTERRDSQTATLTPSTGGEYASKVSHEDIEMEPLPEVPEQGRIGVTRTFTVTDDAV
ncbi:hypothetical protein MMC13_005088 [Lambiella insularis]|nr:hypothetical protein [Lambiella insularis]